MINQSKQKKNFPVRKTERRQARDRKNKKKNIKQLIGTIIKSYTNYNGSFLQYFDFLEVQI